MDSRSNERCSNLELYRIIVMLLIVAHHYVVNSGLTALDGPLMENPLAAKSIFLLLFGMWGKTGINCFVLITGYFMCKSSINAKKYAKLLLEVYFYRFIFGGLFFAVGYTTFSARLLMELLLPVTSIAYSFTNCFLVFYLTIPFLTILVQNMTEKQHRYLLLLCFFTYVIIGSFPGFGITYNYVSWFGVLFFVASYLRMYSREWFCNTKLWGTLTALSVVVSACSVVIMLYYGRKNYDFFVVDSNKVLAVSTSITSFMFFKNLKIKNSRIINSIAVSTFGVLLIHANSDAMRQWLWKDVLNNVGAYNTNYTIIHAVLSVIGVFLICTLIDQLRIRFLEKPVMAKLSEYSWFR